MLDYLIYELIFTIVFLQPSIIILKLHLREKMLSMLLSWNGHEIRECYYNSLCRDGRLEFISSIEIKTP